MITAFVVMAFISTTLVTACGEGHTAEQAAANSTIESKTKNVKNGFDAMPPEGTHAHCPVMKQDFEVAANSPFSVYKGKTYVFCCPSCKAPFEANPEKYLN
jgi:YHS domain-containing protein